MQFYKQNDNKFFSVKVLCRDMKQGYELVIESDDPSVAKFIYRSVNKHLVRFNNFFKNGIRTWIEPHTYSVHFKADKEVLD